jgi:hypothetical protein
MQHYMHCCQRRCMALLGQQETMRHKAQSLCLVHSPLLYSLLCSTSTTDLPNDISRGIRFRQFRLGRSKGKDKHTNTRTGQGYLLSDGEPRRRQGRGVTKSTNGGKPPKVVKTKGGKKVAPKKETSTGAT